MLAKQICLEHRILKNFRCCYNFSHFLPGTPTVTNMQATRIFFNSSHLAAATLRAGKKQYEGNSPTIILKKLIKYFTIQCPCLSCRIWELGYSLDAELSVVVINFPGPLIRLLKYLLSFFL